MAAVVAAAELCENFESILKGCFGPNGLDTMLHSSSGNILMTNYGSVVLKSISVSHAVGRMVVDQIVSHSAVTGDGATTFVIVFTEILREVCNYLKLGRESQSQQLLPEQKRSLVALSRAFVRTEKVALQFLSELGDIATKVTLQRENKIETKNLISYIVKTHLSGKYSATVMTVFVDLLSSLIFGISPSLDEELIAQMIDTFPQLCLKIAGAPVSESKVIPGIVIPREFSTETGKISPDPGSSSFRFVALQCSLDQTEQYGSATLELQDSTHLQAALTFKRRRLVKLFNLFRRQCVKLILSTELASDVVLHFCRQFNIAFVQMVPLEYLTQICGYATIQPLFDVPFEEGFIPDGCLGQSPNCQPELIMNYNYVYLEFYTSGRHGPMPFQLLLCSPTQELCQQNAAALMNALKCVRMSINQEQRELLVLPGGGAVEFVLSEALRIYSKSSEERTLCEACSLLSRGLIAVPQVLHLNSFSNQTRGNNFIHIQPRMKHSWYQDRIPLGIDCRTGNTFNPTQAHIFESFVGKKLFISHLLQILTQLLRIDGVEFGVT